MSDRLFGFPGASMFDAFSRLDRMSREMDRLSRALFGDRSRHLSRQSVFPAVNITEDRDKYYVRAELSGIQVDDVRIEATGRNLTIAGERKIADEDDRTKYHRRERQAGNFSRIVALPGEFDADRIEARLVDGLLTVVLPKPEAAKPRLITVN